MSIVSGTVGAVMGSNAQEEAARTGAAASDRATEVSRQQLEMQQKMMSPYGKIGAQGLAQMYGTDVEYTDPLTGEKTTMAGQGGDFNLMQDPYTGQIMQLPSYEKEYTQALGGYEEDPATRAQRALDTKRMAQQEQQRVGYSTPGASAARSAELGQKYDVQGYDKFKAQLADRYKALQGEFAAKRAMTADKYDQLTQKMNLGLGVTKQLGSAGQNFASQALTGAQQTAQAATAAGQAQAGLWSGLGAASANTAGTALKAYDYGNKAGWFGSGGAASSGGAGATAIKTAPAAEEYGAYLA